MLPSVGEVGRSLRFEEVASGWTAQAIGMLVDAEQHRLAHHLHAGFLEDLPYGSVGRPFSGLDPSGRNLRARFWVVAVIEHEEVGIPA